MNGPVLYHPDVVEAKLRLQSEGIDLVPIPAGKDVFSRVDAPSDLVEVAIVESPLLDMSGVPYLGGRVREMGTQVQFSFELGMHRGLAVTTHGLDVDNAKRVIGSIPIVAQRSLLDPPDDAPLSRVPSVEELRTITSLQFDEGEVVYEPDHGDLGSLSAVRHAGGTDLWVLFMASEELNPLAEFAMSSPNVRMLDSAYAATVVGEHRGDGPKQAYWIQRHRFWHLATLNSLEALVDRVHMVQAVWQLSCQAEMIRLLWAA